MAAIYPYEMPCGYVAKVKGSSIAVSSENFDRYVSIYIAPEAKKVHNKNCTKCN